MEAGRGTGEQEMRAGRREGRKAEAGGMNAGERVVRKEWKV